MIKFLTFLFFACTLSQYSNAASAGAGLERPSDESPRKTINPDDLI